jgi:hypothetical protein
MNIEQSNKNSSTHDSIVDYGIDHSQLSAMGHDTSSPSKRKSSVPSKKRSRPKKDSQDHTNVSKPSPKKRSKTSDEDVGIRIDRPMWNSAYFDSPELRVARNESEVRAVVADIKLNAPEKSKFLIYCEVGFKGKQPSRKIVPCCSLPWENSWRKDGTQGLAFTPLNRPVRLVN